MSWPGRARTATSSASSSCRQKARSSALFFVFFFFGGTEAGGGPQRLARVEQRQAGQVKGRRALRRLVRDNHNHKAAFDALAEGDAATTGEPGVHETFE